MRRRPWGSPPRIRICASSPPSGKSTRRRASSFLATTSAMEVFCWHFPRCFPAGCSGTLRGFSACRPATTGLDTSSRYSPSWRCAGSSPLKDSPRVPRGSGASYWASTAVPPQKRCGGKSSCSRPTGRTSGPRNSATTGCRRIRPTRAFYISTGIPASTTARKPSSPVTMSPASAFACVRRPTTGSTASTDSPSSKSTAPSIRG